MSSAIFKLYSKLYKNSGKVALGLGSFLLVKNSIVHIFPKHLRLGPQGSLNVDMDEMGNTVKMFLRVCEDIDVHPIAVRPFVAESIELCSAGFMAFEANHSVLGIPRTYYCDYLHEVFDLSVIRNLRKRGLRTNDLEEMEETPTEIALMESLLLTKNAKQFSIARHLMYLKGNWALYEAVTPSVFVLLGYISSKYGPAILFRSRAVNFPILLGFTMLSIFGAWFLCKLTKSSLNYKMCQKLDERVTLISKEYAQGAVDFYESMLNFNKALRDLLGKQGKRKLTVYGNFKDGIVINKYGPPLTERKDKYEHLVKEKYKSST